MRYVKALPGIAAAAVVLLFSGQAPLRAMDVQVEALYDNLSIAVLPFLYGTEVLYQDGTQGNYRLYVLDIGTRDPVELHSNQKYLYPLDFGGAAASWITYTAMSGGNLKPMGSESAVGPPGGGDDTPVTHEAEYRVDMLDMLSATATTITTNTDYKEFLGMDDASIVWTDFRHTTATDTFSEVYHCRISNESVTRLTDIVSYKAMVAVEGDKVVWQDYRNAQSNPINADIFVSGLDGSGERAVCSDPGYQAQPDVYGDYVVWQDYRNIGADPQNADIYLYDLVNDEEIEVCTAPGYQAHPRIHGRVVVWHDYRNTETDPQNADIYLYDIDAKEVHAVTTKGGYQAEPSIYESHVVWYDYSDEKIYLATLGATGNIVEYRTPTAGERARTTDPQTLRVYDAAGRCRSIGAAPRSSGLSPQVIFVPDRKCFVTEGR